MTALRTMIRPRQTLARLAAPDRGRGAAAVYGTGFASLGLGVIAALAGPRGIRTAAVVTACLLPVLYTGFWRISCVLVGAAAGRMGLAPRGAALLRATAHTYPVLIPYAALTLIQAVFSSRGWSGGADAIGLLALPIVAWFVALGVLAVQAVYQTTIFEAMSLGLLPYAVLTAAILVLVLGLSALHAAGIG